MGSSFFSQEESMDIRKLETFELIKLTETPDMPEPIVIAAMDELNFREQNTTHEEEIADMIIYFKNP